MAELLGTPLMPWQRYVVDVAFELDPATGRLWYRDVHLVVPRQCGKTTLLLATMTHRATGFAGPQRIAYTAQTRGDARAKWEDDHLPIIDASPFGRGCRARKTNGHEALLWRNGSQQTLMASTKKSGHGPTLDLGVVDEAFAQIDGRLEQANKPAMITRPSPQLWIVSTAGESPQASPFLWGKVEAGRARCLAGRSSRVAYFEWSADDDADRMSPAVWLATIPAIGHTIELDAIAAEADAMDSAEFDRAFLCLWTPSRSTSPIAADAWSAGVRKGMRLRDPVSFAIDATPDRSWASIGAAGDVEGRPGVLGVQVVDHRRGVSWVVPRMVELVERHGPRAVTIDGSSPASSLIDELEAKGVTVLRSSADDLVSACGSMFDGLTRKTSDAVDAEWSPLIVHTEQPVLDRAVAGVGLQMVGDRFKWRRRSTVTVISPLVAVTLAAWAHGRPLEDDESGDDFAMVVG